MTKGCSYTDILVNAGSKAMFIGGITNIIFNGVFSPDRLILTKITTNIVGNFISYGIREYATKCLDDMQYVGGFVGGFLKYKITNNNPFIGGINNLSYEICNFHNLTSNICMLVLEPLERVTKKLINTNIADMDTDTLTPAFFEGLIYSSILITNIQIVYPLLDLFGNIIKNTNNINSEQFNLNDSMCLLGETYILEQVE